MKEPIQSASEPCLTNGYGGKCVDCPDKNGCYGKNGCYDTDNSEDNQEG